MWGKEQSKTGPKGPRFQTKRRYLWKRKKIYKAEQIGIVCPLSEFDLPVIVWDFIMNSEFETEYFYIVMTYGMHHGGCAARNAKVFEKSGRHIDYFNTVKNAW